MRPKRNKEIPINQRTVSNVSVAEKENFRFCFLKLIDANLLAVNQPLQTQTQIPACFH